MPVKRWSIRPPAPPEALKQYSQMLPLLAQVLYNRGFDDPGRARAFLDAADSSEGRLLGFRQRRAIDQAIARIRQAVASRERVVVYGDFDADGVTSTALLTLTLKALGANVEPYIPHRVDEGYGLNSAALTALRKKGVRLVITVDCGIRSIEEARLAREYGLDLIITDHHSVGAEVPDAYAVINPKLPDCSYTEPMLAGVGVAYRIAEALLMVASNGRRPPALQPDSLLDLVAIGTVADLAPLDRQENRALVRRGLERLRRTERLGLRALLEAAGTPPERLSARDIGFIIGPRINAAGRLDSAMKAYHLLTTTDPAEAAALADELNRLNTQRQERTVEAQERVRAQIEVERAVDAPLIFAGSPDFLPGIVGLVAGRLTEEYYRPAIILEHGETESRASCRSTPHFDITHALDQCADLLVRHGGHAQAAGFTVLNDNIPALRERLMELAEEALRAEDEAPTVEIDAELDLSTITLEAVEDLGQLEPTGSQCSAPTFAAFGVRVADSRMVGRNKDALKLRVAGSSGTPIDAIGFRMAGWQPEAGERVDLAFSLEINTFRDKRQPQLVLLDVAPENARQVVRA